MALDSFKKKISDAKDKVAGFTIDSSEQVIQWLEEYKQAMQSLQVFGFKMGKIHVTAGVLPEISATITGSVNNINPQQVQKMLEEKRQEKLLAAVLSALLTLAKVREVIDLGFMQTVVIQICLGIPPRVMIDMT
jgi:hypothetical protein